MLNEVKRDQIGHCTSTTDGEWICLIRRCMGMCGLALPCMRGLVLSALLAQGLLGSVGQAEVTTSITPDGTLGTVVQPPVGNVYNIEGGTRPGNGPNLFHSLATFCVGSADTANFNNDTGMPTSNILARITGGMRSDIAGTIQTDPSFGNANLFLTNPAGWVFSGTSSMNVGGAVNISTADYIRMDDVTNSANFYANPASDGLANSVLAMAPVVDFGFLQPAALGFAGETAPVIADGSTAAVTIQALSVANSSPISLVGRDATGCGRPTTFASPRPSVWTPMTSATWLTRIKSTGPG